MRAQKEWHGSVGRVVHGGGLKLCFCNLNPLVNSAWVRTPHATISFCFPLSPILTFVSPVMPPLFAVLVFLFLPRLVQHFDARGRIGKQRVKRQVTKDGRGCRGWEGERSAKSGSSKGYPKPVQRQDTPCIPSLFAIATL